MHALTSGRLEYERLTPALISVFHALARDPYVAHFLLDGEQVPLDWARAEISHSDALFEQAGVGIWLVHEKAADQAIGFTGFRIFPELDPEPQLLYALREPFAKRGYATEMAQALVAFARRQRLERIVSAADEPNLASRRVLEKTGFVEAGAVPGAFGAIVLYEHESSASRAFSGLERTLEIARSWDGGSLPVNERVSVRLELGDTELRVAVDAPWHGDPAPPLPPGACPRLWEHEVAELFLLGDDQRYLEIELGPHGHYLVLAFHGRRRVTSFSPQGRPIFYTAERTGSRWRGLARVPRAWLPPGLTRGNAYAISGEAPARRHLAWQPVPGAMVDFHSLERFARIDVPE